VPIKHADADWSIWLHKDFRMTCIMPRASPAVMARQSRSLQSARPCASSSPVHQPTTRHARVLHRPRRRHHGRPPHRPQQPPPNKNRRHSKTTGIRPPDAPLRCRRRRPGQRHRRRPRQARRAVLHWCDGCRRRAHRSPRPTHASCRAWLADITARARLLATSYDGI